MGRLSVLVHHHHGLASSRSLNSGSVIFSCRRLLSSSSSSSTEQLTKKIIEDKKNPWTLNKAVKELVVMCGGLQRDGHEKQAFDLFNQVFSSEKPTFPLLTSTTWQIKQACYEHNPIQALNVYNSFLESGGKPNAYMYMVLIHGLSDYETTMTAAKRIMMEMIGKRMKPRVNTVMLLLLSLGGEGKVEEGRELVAEIRTLGLMPGNEEIEEILERLSEPTTDYLRDIKFCV